MTAADLDAAAPARPDAMSRSAPKASGLRARRLQNFKANKRAYWSLWVFLLLFGLSLAAELIANDKPLLISYRGEILSPIVSFYPETRFNGDLQTEADYTDPVVTCLIRTGGEDLCFDEPETATASDPGAAGWILRPLVPWSHDTINKDAPFLPAPPSADNWLGTDEIGRDLLAVTIYGFRLSVSFGLIVTLVATVIGVAAGAVQGFFGGWVDLLFQRFIEIWGAIPMLYVIMIVSAVFATNFWMLTFLVTLFSWPALVGVVRAEFLRARNFEYVRAAQALGVSNTRIMFRHVLPNAMVATVTLLPFLLTSAIGTLAILDFLGFGLQEAYPSLGEIGLQAKKHLHAPWLILTSIITFAVMLTLLVFIFEGVRDAFDPRKVFAPEEPEETAAAEPAPRKEAAAS